MTSQHYSDEERDRIAQERYEDERAEAAYEQWLAGEQARHEEQLDAEERGHDERDA